jgi:mevalonate kinase
MAISASSPSKIILCGEHFVVYGAPAISIPVEPRNSATLSEIPVRDEIRLKSSLGEGVIKKDGSYEGAPALSNLAATYKFLHDKLGIGGGFDAKLSYSGVPKGMGASASVCSAFAYALCKSYGMNPTEQLIFDATQAGELVAHGARASGIDAITVIRGRPQMFQRHFNDSPRFDFHPFSLALPEHTCFMVADTYRGVRSSTLDMVKKFAHGVEVGSTLPPELDSGQRERIISPYMPFYEKIKAQLKPDGDQKLLGALLDRNHTLLAERGVSCDEIDEAVEVAKGAGALGAKLTAAGGKGGAVLIYCRKFDTFAITDALAKRNYRAFELRVANKGTEVGEKKG